MARTFFETLVAAKIAAREAALAARAFGEDIDKTVRATRRMIDESRELLAEAHTVLEAERRMWRSS